MKFKSLVSLAALCGALALGSAAQAQIQVKLGVLNDRSGLYADLTGEGSVVAARMAVEDFKAAEKGIQVEIISADHQNKADVGSSIAREWYDAKKVDAIFDVTNSAVTLAVMAIAKEKNGIVVIGGSSTTRATTDSCTPNFLY